MTIQNKTEFENRNNRMERFVKRSTDILLSVPCLILSSPLFAIISLAIKWEDGLPIIYKQERIGLHGKPFNIYKFRSMKADAEKMVQFYWRLKATRDSLMLENSLELII